MSPALMPVLVLMLLLVCAPLRAIGCSPYIEEDSNHSYATFRANVNAFEHCTVSEETYRQVVSIWLRSRDKDLPELTSLSLGRAVEFPWISRHIADTAVKMPNWKEKIAGTRPGRRDALASEIIRDPRLLDRLAVPFEGTKYRLTGLSYEKVLYGKASEFSSNKDAGTVMVPFDAQLWLRLTLRQQAE